jgi:hypothetical protein
MIPREARTFSLVIGATLLCSAPSIRAQLQPVASAPSGMPKFEVASIKRCKDQPGLMRGGGESTPGRVSTGCLPLAEVRGPGLIQRAYVRFAGVHVNRC